MKYRIDKIIIVLMLFCIFTDITAQSVASRATANIISALSLTKAEGTQGELDWGDIVAGSTTSTVYLSPDETGIRTIGDPGATLASSNTGNAAKFMLSGEENATVDISILSPDIVLDDAMGNFMNASLALSEDVTILTEGEAEIYVGGMLTIGPEQSLGSYSGYFELNVHYQ